MNYGDFLQNTSPPPCSRHHAGGSPAKKKLVRSEGWLRSAEFTVTRNCVDDLFCKDMEFQAKLNERHV